MAETVSGGNSELLSEQLIENTDGPLNEYLKQLDLDSEGITDAEGLIKHLEGVAKDESFSMDEVRGVSGIS